MGGPEPERCDQFRFADGPPGVMAMVEDGRLTRISLLSGATLDTDRGLGPGDTAEAVRAAYGARARTGPHKYAAAPAAYITVWEKGGGGAEEFVEDPAARGIVYEIGTDGKVTAVHAGGPSIQYVEGCL
ncbi:MAG: hypothetical protein ACK40O_10930 [Allosphingosinicella sp.]